MTQSIEQIAKELSLFQLNTLKRLDEIEKRIDECQSTQAQMEQGFGDQFRYQKGEIARLKKIVNKKASKIGVLVKEVEKKLENNKPKESIFSRLFK